MKLNITQKTQNVTFCLLEFHANFCLEPQISCHIWNIQNSLARLARGDHSAGIVNSRTFSLTLHRTPTYISLPISSICHQCYQCNVSRKCHHTGFAAVGLAYGRYRSIAAPASGSVVSSSSQFWAVPHCQLT